MTITRLYKLMNAADNADWGQVAHNCAYGPPCFNLEDDGRFCLRSKVWEGHQTPFLPGHRYVSLGDLLGEVRS